MEKTTDPERNIPEISIIVPVYNVERYVEKCLDSISGQSFKDWECIVVDDGSVDNSGLICDKYSVDNRFIIIHRENGGVSEARNTALKSSKGRYIAFVDPDDWIEPNYLEKLYHLSIKNDADVVQCGFSREFTNHSHNKHLTDKEKVVGHEEAMLGLLSPYKIPTLLWNKLFRREVISQDFPVDLTYEDAYIIPVWFRNVKKVVLTPDILYHYRNRKGSITKCGVAQNHYNFVISCINLGDMVHKEVPDRFDLDARNRYVYKIMISGAKTIARKESIIDKRREIIKKLSQELRQINSFGIKEIGLKLWLRGKMLKESPVFFEKIMRGVNKFDLHSKFRKSHLFE